MLNILKILTKFKYKNKDVSLVFLKNFYNLKLSLYFVKQINKF